MRDVGWVAECLRVNAEERARLVGGLRQLGIACDESFANFRAGAFRRRGRGQPGGRIAYLNIAGHPFVAAPPQGLRLSAGAQESPSVGPGQFPRGSWDAARQFSRGPHEA